MKSYIYLTIITVAEATIGVFVKLTGGNVPIFSLNFFRVFFALLFLAITVPFIKKNFYKINKSEIKPILIIGALIAAQISLFNIAMSMAPIANVVIFWSVAPFFVFIFSTIFLKEKVKKEHIFIFLIAFIGILIAKPLSGVAAMGNIIALVDGAIYAALVTYIRHQDKSGNPSLIFWFMLMASVYLLPFVFIYGVGNITGSIYYETLGMSIPVLVWVACLGVVSTGLAYIFITLVLEKINASIYSLVDIIVSPIVAAVFGYFIFNEIPSKNMFYGAVLLLVSGFWLSEYMSGENSFVYRHLLKYFKKEKGTEELSPIIKHKQIK